MPDPDRPDRRRDELPQLGEPDIANTTSADDPLHRIDPHLGSDQLGAAGSDESVVIRDGILGDFRLIREIGRGGMGTVYEAEQLSLGRIVAVKLLPFGAMLDPQQRKRFQNEARAAATLAHPHIVPVYFVGQARGVHFYAMHLIDGISLAELIDGMRAAATSPRHSFPAAWWWTRTRHCLANDGSRKRGRTPIAGTARRVLRTIGVRPLFRRRPLFRSKSICETVPRNKDQEGGVTTVTSEVRVSMPAVHPCGPSALESAGPGDPDRKEGADPQPESWQTTLRTDQPLEYFRSVARMGAQAAEALQHAHEVGVLHRDIKPGNLLLDRTGRLWVADFGLATIEYGEQLTRTGEIVGTAAYMSPEQATDSHLVDGRSDVYSLGATLYEMLTLRSHRGGVSGSDLPYRPTIDVRPLTTIDRRIPVDLETIVLKALAYRRGDRYASAGELADDLKAFVAGREIQARRLSWWQRQARRLDRHRGLTAAAIAVTILLLTAFGGVMTYYSRRLSDRGEALQAALVDANQSRRETEKQTRLAEQRLLRAEQSEHHLQERVYGADMKLASQALAENDLHQVRAYLERHVPKPGDQDLRDFVWHYLSRRISQQPLAEFLHPEAVYKVSYSADGHRLVTACADGHARVWDPNAPGQPDIDIDTRHGECNCASFDRAGRRLATTGDDRAIRIWNLETQALVHTIHDAHEGMGYNVLFTHDGNRVVSCGEDSHVRVWEVASGELLSDWESHPGHTCEALALSPDGNVIASVGTDACLVLNRLTENPASRTLVRRQLTHRNLQPKLRDLAYTPVGIFAVNVSGFLYHYLITKDEVNEFHKLFRDEPQAMASSNDGLIVVADDVGNLTRLRIENGQAAELRFCRAHASRVWSLTFHPAGDRVASGGADGWAKIHSASFDAPVKRWELFVRRLCFWIVFQTAMWSS